MQPSLRLYQTGLLYARGWAGHQESNHVCHNCFPVHGRDCEFATSEVSNVFTIVRKAQNSTQPILRGRRFDLSTWTWGFHFGPSLFSNRFHYSQLWIRLAKSKSESDPQNRSLKLFPKPGNCGNVLLPCVPQLAHVCTAPVIFFLFVFSIQSTCLLDLHLLRFIIHWRHRWWWSAQNLAKYKSIM